MPHTNDDSRALGDAQADDGTGNGTDTLSGDLDGSEANTDVNSDDQTFDTEYVGKLREENAKFRTRARDAEQRVDELAKRLHAELVRATGLLADPTDLAFDPEHLADADKLTEAIDALVAAKPHLKSRKPAGAVGQGQRGGGDGPTDFTGLFRR